MKVMQPSRQEYEQRKEWERQEKLDHFRVAAKMMEFVGVVVGVIAIFVLLALIALTWLLYFWLPARSAKNTLNRQRKGYLRAVSLETAFSENGVHMLNIATEGEMHLTYDAFVYCTETEELLLLKTKGKQVLMLLKSGFSLGDEKEFKAFMRRKCPGVRFFWKKA